MLINKNGVYFRKWTAAKAKAVVLSVHGMGAQSERSDDLGKFLRTKKISTYAIQLRGYGELAQKPGYVKSMKLYYEDIAVLKEIIKSENKGRPIFLLGESMGGVISHTIVLDHDSGYAGLIEIVPVFLDNMNMGLMQKVSIAVSALFNPEKQILMPFKTEELTRDTAVVKKLNKDKRETKIASAGLLLHFLLAQLRAVSKPRGIKIPVLFLLASKDMLGDVNFSVNFFNKLSADKELIMYKDSYHSLTIEKNRKEVFKDIYSWIEKKMAVKKN
jgi:alpha-beta hydrolase superfamily lysophospholipase